MYQIKNFIINNRTVYTLSKNDCCNHQPNGRGTADVKCDEC